jgi:hypothetical protein
MAARRSLLIVCGLVLAIVSPSVAFFTQSERQLPLGIDHKPDGSLDGPLQVREEYESGTIVLSPLRLLIPG